MPTIACPPNATLATAASGCVANHSYTVTASDDQPGWTLAQTAGLPSGSDFPLGATVNSFVVTDTDGNSASCSFTVTVEDRIVPICIPPVQVAVSCEQFDPSLTAYGEPTLTDNCCVSQLLKSANYALFDSLCSRGTVTRIFQAFDCAGNSSQCTQRVVVNYGQDYYIKFPDDTLATVCNLAGIYGRPVFFGEDCELLGVSYEDQVFGIQPPDACYKIERTWTVINWCNYDPGLPLTYVPNPTLVLTAYSNPLNAPGPIVSACGAPMPWAPTISKINPADTAATNFCTFWSANANGYVYKQIVKILDTVAAPLIANCPAAHATFVDSTGNDPNYWNNVFSPGLPPQDLGEVLKNLTITVSDTCSGPNVNIEYLLFLDLDADSQQETVINSVNLGIAGLGWNNVLYGNIGTPNYTGGTPTSFDNRPVPANQKWGFSIHETIIGNTKTASVRWNTQQQQNTHVIPALPHGTHKIKWIVQDGCGNESNCEYGFTIQPSAFECIPPADVVVSCEQFDPSLLAYGEPNLVSSCCIDTLLQSAGYALFDTICSRGTITRIFSALDCCGNTSQCSQRIVVNYAQDYYVKFPNDVIVTACDGSGNYGEPIFFGEDCELLGVSYDDWSEPGVPDACFKFERTWTVINWCTYNPLLNVTNVPNPNPNAIANHLTNLPGPIVSACGTAPPWASTIVKISPTDPAPTDFCTFWSANANGYKYKQLVKILDSTPPTISNCPAPPSHLDDATQNDPELWNLDLPAQDLRETPIDLTVTVADDCSGGNVNIEYLLYLDLDANGVQETVVNSVSVGLAGLGWNNVRYNNLNTPNFNGGTPTTFDDRPVPTDQKWGFSIQETIAGNEKTASVRWNTAQSPNTHVVPALPNGRHKIRWFVTDGCGNNSECERTFSIGDTTLVGTNAPDSDGFALYQNEPNPFGNSTAIRFQLPEPATATLSVFDAGGRIVHRQTADYGSGMHTITLEKDRFASPGILFYKLEAGAQVAWRKMVVLR